jgi:hypothetical protein
MNSLSLSGYASLMLRYRNVLNGKCLFEISFVIVAGIIT